MAIGVVYPFEMIKIKKYHRQILVRAAFVQGHKLLNMLVHVALGIEGGKRIVSADFFELMQGLSGERHGKREHDEGEHQNHPQRGIGIMPGFIFYIFQINAGAQYPVPGFKIIHIRDLESGFRTVGSVPVIINKAAALPGRLYKITHEISAFYIGEIEQTHARIGLGAAIGMHQFFTVAVIDPEITVGVEFNRAKHIDSLVFGVGFRQFQTRGLIVKMRDNLHAYIHQPPGITHFFLLDAGRQTFIEQKDDDAHPQQAQSRDRHELMVDIYFLGRHESLEAAKGGCLLMPIMLGRDDVNIKQALTGQIGRTE